MNTLVWVDGVMRAPGAPVIDPLDHGFLVGDGVFETISVRAGQPFALRRHLDRLRASAVGMGWPGIDDDAVNAGIQAVVAAGGDSVDRVRVTLSAGPGPLGLRRAADAVPTVVVAGSGGAPSVETCRAVRVPWVRNERSAVVGLKTTSYAEAVVMAAYAAERGASEVLLANTVDDLCEGASSNLFIERDGELFTPALSSGCLAGVTRALVIEWSRAAGITVNECERGELRYGVLAQVTDGRAALAVTGSIRGIAPVVSLDGVETSAGELFAEVRDIFERRAEEQINP